jgi:hemoglobin
MLADIENENDIKLFSDLFYQRLLADEKINHHFLPLNLEEHMPRIYGFWKMILFGDTSYKSNMMLIHKPHNITKDEFPIWLGHFEATIRANFEGDRAEEVISRANMIAVTMRYKLVDAIL